MGTSSKRYGLEVKNDLELEQRLRRMETAIAGLARTSDFGDTSEDLQKITNVPQVTGLRVLGKTPGAITVAWNQVRISDLRRYELDVAEDLAFTTNKQTFNVAGTEYQFSTVTVTGGGGNTAIYVRVRARSRTSVGPYSVTLNAVVGQAQSEDIADGAITTEKVDPDEPLQYTGLNDSDVGSKLALSGYQNGVILSNNATDTEYDIDISAGVVRDSTNVLSISNASTITKRIDASWESGSGGGGLASAVSLLANTAYFVFLLSNSDGSSVDAGFDTSPTAANLLDDTGTLTLYRRRGCVVTDASSKIRAFHQYGDFFQYDSPAQDPASYTSSNPGTSELTHTLSLVPVGIQCRVQLTIAWRPTDSSNWNGYVAFSSGYDSSLAASSSNNDGGVLGDGRVIEFLTDMLLSADATFKTDQGATTGTLRLYFQIHSWIDLRGKDGTT